MTRKKHHPTVGCYEAVAHSLSHLITNSSISSSSSTIGREGEKKPRLMQPKSHIHEYTHTRGERPDVFCLREQCSFQPSSNVFFITFIRIHKRL